MRFTRPDVAYAVGTASRYNNCFTAEHWNLVKRILAYLLTTRDLGITYSHGLSNELEVYVNANYGGDVADCKSTTGYLIKMNGGAISWISKRQSTIALSTAEAEYVAAATLAQELLWIKSFLGEIGEELKLPIRVLEDNQACIAIAENLSHHQRIKHVNLKYHFLQDLVKDGIIEFVYCPSEDMVADGMTKPLPRGKFEMFRQCIGLKGGGVLECRLTDPLSNKMECDGNLKDKLVSKMILEECSKAKKVME